MNVRHATTILSALLFCTLAAADDPYIDLHSHLFMKDGLGVLFSGKFSEKLHAHKWSDGFSSQANAETLEASHLGLVVVSLFASQPYVLNTRDSIRKQIALAEEFVKSHSDWVIARSASEAEKAIAAGKRVLVLSLEGASSILETDADIHEFIDEKGIRIVTFSHLMDDEYGGSALLASYHALSDPLGWLKAVFGRGNVCERVTI